MDGRNRILVASLAVLLLVAASAVAGRLGGATAAAEIAYSCTGDICLMDANGNGRRQLTRDKWIDSYPAWSSNGRTIAFTGNLGKTVIYVMNADGSDRQRLTPRGGDEAMPAWSPDGHTIAFDDNVSGAVYLTHLDGTGRRRLTGGPSSLPTWSPDGSRLAFVSHDGRRLALTEGDVDVIGADGKRMRRLVENGTFPAWSPTDARIAFLRNTPDGEAEIWLVDADGSGLRRLPARSSRGGGLSWSPDGSRLVYALGDDIYSIAVDGGAPRLLEFRGVDTSPAWRP